MDSPKIITFYKALSILLPLLIGLVRYNKIDKSYKPFILYLAVGSVTEIASFISILSVNSNAIISNIFILTEWLFISWQFFKWGTFFKAKKSFIFLVAFISAFWLVENIVAIKLNVFSPYYRLLYSFCIVLMSVTVINYTIVNEYKSIFTNAKFLICLGFIILFVYKIIYEWAYQMSVIKSYPTLSNNIIDWSANVNVLVNVIFAIAVYFFPARSKLTIE